MDLWVRHLPQEHKDLDLGSQDLCKDGPAVEGGCSQPLARWEVEAGKPPGPHGHASLAHAAPSQRPWLKSNGRRGRSPRLFFDLQMWTVARICLYIDIGTER